MDLGVDLGTTYSAVAAMEFTLRRERNLLVDLDSTILHIPMAEVARACKPLIDRTIETMEPLSSLLNGANSDIAGIHLVGGTTSLPIVPRRLRELCGRKVHRSLIRRLQPPSAWLSQPTLAPSASVIVYRVASVFSVRQNSEVGLSSTSLPTKLLG